jgi:hypothetical protein
LHVSTVDGPPPGFPPASPRARIDHHLSGPNAGAPARSASRTSGRQCRPPSGGLPAFRFRCAAGPLALSLARALDSLVRVSRRVGRYRLVSVTGCRGMRLRRQTAAPAPHAEPGSRRPGPAQRPAKRHPSTSGPARASGGPHGVRRRPWRPTVRHGPGPTLTASAPSAPRSDPSGRAGDFVLPPCPSEHGRVRVAPRRRRYGPLPPRRFQALLTPLSRFFSPFRRRTCSLSVSPRYLALDETYHPIWTAISNSPTLRRVRSAEADGGRTGISPSTSPPFQAGSGPRSPPRGRVAKPHFAGPWDPEIRFGRCPLRSPLLRTSLLVSFPPVINMLKFTG